MQEIVGSWVRIKGLTPGNLVINESLKNRCQTMVLKSNAQIIRKERLERDHELGKTVLLSRKHLIQ